MPVKFHQILPFGIMIEPDKDNTDIHSLDIDSLKILFQENQLVVLRGFDTFSSKETFSCYCEQFGEISQWPFGTVLELIEQQNPADHIFDHRYMPMHWDGMYRPQVPEYQIFHCVKAPLTDQGGGTTFSNTKLILEDASNSDKELWQQVTGHYQRQMEFYQSKTTAPTICKHPFRDYSVIRYNEPVNESDSDFINPPNQTFTGLKAHELKIFHLNLKQALYSPKHYLAHQWQTNDVVIADNFTLLHGREAFVSRSPRHLQRVHVLSSPPLDNPHLDSHQ